MPLNKVMEHICVAEGSPCILALNHNSILFCVKQSFVKNVVYTKQRLSVIAVFDVELFEGAEQKEYEYSNV